MTSTQPRPTSFWVLTGSSAKRAFDLYFDPLHALLSAWRHPARMQKVVMPTWDPMTMTPAGWEHAEALLRLPLEEQKALLRLPLEEQKALLRLPLEEQKALLGLPLEEQLPAPPSVEEPMTPDQAFRAAW